MKTKFENSIADSNRENASIDQIQKLEYLSNSKFLNNIEKTRILKLIDCGISNESAKRIIGYCIKKIKREEDNSWAKAVMKNIKGENRKSVLNT